MQRVNNAVPGNNKGQGTQVETVKGTRENGEPSDSPGWVGDPSQPPSTTPKDTVDKSPNGATRPSPAYRNDQGKK